MLEQILDYIHNYFEKDIVRGTFTISSGELPLDFLLENQYFRIVGSVFNDGVHQYPAMLTDETFTGEIWAMAIPPRFLSVVDDIETWMGKYGGAIESPYQSESFGGYSYTKKSGGSSGSSGNDVGSWQSVFASSLNAWRKIS